MFRAMIRKVPGAYRIARILGLVPRRADSRSFLLDMLPRKSVGVEIGVHKGDFSKSMLEVVRPRELHLIDPWKHEASTTYKDAWYGGQANGQAEMDERYRQVCARFEREIRRGQVTVHRACSAAALGGFPDEYFDWVYIDGNHLYEYVKADLELALAKTRPGGFIAGDDYTEGGWWQGGVKKAVDEFAATQAVQRVAIRNDQFVFRKEPVA